MDTTVRQRKERCAENACVQALMATNSHLHANWMNKMTRSDASVTLATLERNARNAKLTITETREYLVEDAWLVNAIIISI